MPAAGIGESSLNRTHGPSFIESSSRATFDFGTPSFQRRSGVGDPNISPSTRDSHLLLVDAGSPIPCAVIRLLSFIAEVAHLFLVTGGFEPFMSDMMRLECKSKFARIAREEFEGSNRCLRMSVGKCSS